MFQQTQFLCFLPIVIGWSYLVHHQHLKHNQNPTCFPNDRTCIRDAKIGSHWSYSYLSQLGTDMKKKVIIPDETCEEWSTFTNWNKYGLNPLVLPGEICFNPCTGSCIAPLSY